MRRILGWLLALAAAWSVTAASLPMQAPSGVWGFRHFGTEEGLTNVSTTAMAQDSEGFLWVGTEDGLFRLEGNHFHHFSEEDGLPTSRIESGGLAPGLRHGLWVVTSRGMVFWDGRRFLHPASLGLKGLDAKTGVALPQGGAVLSDHDHQTRYLSLDGEPFQPLTGLPWGDGLTAATGSADGRTLAFALTRDLWVRRDGVWAHRDLAWELAEDIQALWIDGSGRIWIRSAERLLRLPALGAPLEPVLPTSPLSMVNSARLGMDNRGRLWTNSAEGLIWIENGASGLIASQNGLPQGGADTLMVDRQGTVWIGGEGIHKLLGEGLWMGYTRRQGLPTDIVWSILRTRDGLLWAGTAGGLVVGDAQGWTTLPGTRSNQIMALDEDLDGNLWVGHLPSRERPFPLSVRPKGTRKLLPLSLPGTVAQGTAVLSVVAEGETLWLGTNRLGLLRAPRRGSTLGTCEPVPIPSWTSDAFVSYLARDGRGGLWVGGSAGVAHWNGSTWATLKQAGGLPDDSIISIAPLPNGEAWLAFTEARALARVRREGDHLSIVALLKRPSPLLASPVVALAARPDGSLWLGTSRGLLRWDGLHVERYAKSTGLPGEDCAQNALWFDPNGDVWVGLSVGLARGRVGARCTGQAPPPAVIFSATRSDGRAISLSSGVHEIPWRARTLTFTYGPGGSVRTEEVTYQVRLEGLEDAWRDTTFPEARYPRLVPGYYRFEVRTVNSVGEFGAAQGLDVRILAPWWLKPWVILLELLALVGLVFLALRWRTAMLRRNNALLETLVKARTEELEAANRALEEVSMSDPLTGLHNRRFLSLTMPEEVARVVRTFRDSLQRGLELPPAGEDFLLFMVDLDHFKDVNDLYGHAAGDAVLQQAALLLRSASREADSLVRWGGEEFLLVAKRTSRGKGAIIARNLLEAFRAQAFLLPDGTKIVNTCSVGYSAFPVLPWHPEAFSWQQAIELADQCLYAAKNSGRNAWVGATFRRTETTEASCRELGLDLQALEENGVVDLVSSLADPDGLRWKS